MASARPAGRGYGAVMAPAVPRRPGRAAAGVTTAADRCDVVGADRQICSLRVWSGADTERDARDGWWGGEGWTVCVVEAARERGGRTCGRLGARGRGERTFTG